MHVCVCLSLLKDLDMFNNEDTERGMECVFVMSVPPSMRKLRLPPEVFWTVRGTTNVFTLSVRKDHIWYETYSNS